MQGKMVLRLKDFDPFYFDGIIGQKSYSESDFFFLNLCLTAVFKYFIFHKHLLYFEIQLQKANAFDNDIFL